MVAGGSYEVVLQNSKTTHADFTDLPVLGARADAEAEARARVLATVRSVTLAFFERCLRGKRSPLLETTPPGNEMQRWVLATYPDDAHDILLSGWISGEERLTRKAAAVAMTYGKGRIVLFGFRPQHRGQTHATFPMIFDALYWGR